MTLDLSRFLKDIFDQRKVKNPRYSLRAFARDLVLDSSTLSSILAGRRKVSAKQVAKLLKKLGVEDTELQMRFIASAAGVDIAKPEREYTVVDLEVFATVRDWEHTAVLAAYDVDPSITEARLAEALDLPAARVGRVVTRLRELGMLEKNESGWRPTNPHHVVSPQVPNDDMRECHRQFIEKAVESLSRDPMEVRDFSGITMSFDSSKLSAIRQTIREFRRKIAELADNGQADSVYRLNVQLFPLTKEKIK